MLLPFHMDTTKFNAQEAGDLDHSWSGTHQASDSGAWNKWVGAKGEETMGHFTRADIPWQYALADAFTICDAYHCSIQGPTTPNRLYLWSGMIDPAGDLGGPAISNPADYNPVYQWTTYPERLQKAGVSWQVYANDEVGDGDDGWVGDYGDNPLWLFQAYHDALASADPKVRQLAERASLRDAWKPDSGRGGDVSHVLSQFIGDCAAGTLPTVSWIVAPYGYCEHPQARPVDGADYINRALTALWANQELWESTVVLIDFDENDGFFDHVVPPTAPPGTAAEFVDGLPIGLGPRVPMTIVSPWSRGGWVNSQVFDHTSVLRFLEVVTGVKETNISDWRREICGDLTSCFDFSKHDPSIPKLPDVTKLVAEANTERILPPVAAPAPGSQAQPKQERKTRKPRPLPYRGAGNVSLDRVTGDVTATFTNTGRQAMGLSIYANSVVPFAATPVVVPAAGSDTYVWHGADTDGVYDFSAYGPNGFVRSFAGTVISGSRTDVGLPAVRADVDHNGLRLRLHNAGHTPVRFTLTAVDFGTQVRTVYAGYNQTHDVIWPTVNGFYDVAITANTGTGFSYRFAGRIER